MKYFVAIALCALIGGVFADGLPEYNEQQKAWAKQYVEHCKKKVNISEEEVDKLRKNDFSSPTNAQKCFARCTFEQAGTLKDDVVQEDVVFQKLSPLIGEEKAKEVMANCSGLKGVDNCDTALKMFECYENGKADAKILIIH